MPSSAKAASSIRTESYYGGYINWNNVNGAKVNDWTNFAYIENDYSTAYDLQALVAYDFGFSIPAGATIDGIQVKVFNQASHASYGTRHVEDERLALLVNQTYMQESSGNQNAGYWSATPAEVPYGNGSYLWGETWTDSLINSSDFGVVLLVEIVSDGTTVIAYVDYIQIEVWYTTAGGSGSQVRTLLLMGVG